MDMSFANQSLSLEYLKKNAKTLSKDVQVVRGTHMEVARFKLKTWAITIDVLTSEQERYLRSWSEGSSLTSTPPAMREPRSAGPGLAP